MRALRSVVAIVSTALLMACQTAASTGMNRQSPLPVAASQATQTASPASTGVSYAAAKAAAPAAVPGARKTTWIIIGLLVAIAVVAVILVSGGEGGGGIY